MEPTSSVQIAIACTNERAGRFAVELSRSRFVAGVWLWEHKNWLRWNGDTWVHVDVGELTETHLLIRHEGDKGNFEEHKPSTATFQKVLWFSTSDTYDVASPGECPFPAFGPSDKWPLLKKDVDELVDWARGARSRLPDFAVRRPPSQAILPAIAILCQGYLAVHMNPDTTELEGVSDEAAEPVNLALYRMQWREFLRGGGRELLGAEILDSEKRQALRSRVQKRDWWAVLYSGESLANVLCTEWGTASGDGFSAVTRLIMAIEGKEEHQPPVPADIVAQAYAAFCDHPDLK